MRNFIVCLIVLALAGTASARIYYSDGGVHNFTTQTHESIGIENGTTINIGNGVVVTLTREATYSTTYVGSYYGTGPTNYLNLSGNGQLLFSQEMALSLADGTEPGTVTMTGTSYMNPSGLAVGQRGDSLFSITDDATLELRADGTLYTPGFNVGNNHYGFDLIGTFDQSGNATVLSVGSGLDLGGSNTGIYNMSGGTLTLGGAISGAGADDEFNFSGGTIVMDGYRLPWNSARDWFHVTGPYAGNYTETYADGKTTLQIIPGVTAIITESLGSTEVQEGGATDSYEIVLSDTPTADVTVTATPGDSEIDIGEGTGVPKTLTFTISNWDTAQTITVTAYDDTVYEGGEGGTPHITTISHSAQQTGGSGEYEGASISAVDVSVIDDDLGCGDWGYIPADFNQDCRVNLLDFAMLASKWLLE